MNKSALMRPITEPQSFRCVQTVVWLPPTTAPQVVDPPGPQRSSNWVDHLWLAMSDGRVLYGKALIWLASGEVHSWFAEGQHLDCITGDTGATLVAWARVMAPNHPVVSELAGSAI